MSWRAQPEDMILSIVAYCSGGDLAAVSRINTATSALMRSEKSAARVWQPVLLRKYKEEWPNTHRAKDSRRTWAVNAQRFGVFGWGRWDDRMTCWDVADYLIEEEEGAEALVVWMAKSENFGLRHPIWVIVLEFLAGSCDQQSLLVRVIITHTAVLNVSDAAAVAHQILSSKSPETVACVVKMGPLTVFAPAADDDKYAASIKHDNIAYVHITLEKLRMCNFKHDIADLA